MFWYYLLCRQIICVRTNLVDAVALEYVTTTILRPVIDTIHPADAAEYITVLRDPRDTSLILL